MGDRAPSSMMGVRRLLLAAVCLCTASGLASHAAPDTQQGVLASGGRVKQSGGAAPAMAIKGSLMHAVVGKLMSGLKKMPSPAGTEHLTVHEQLLARAQKAFAWTDENKDGTLSLEELMAREAHEGGLLGKDFINREFDEHDNHKKRFTKQEFIDGVMKHYELFHDFVDGTAEDNGYVAPKPEDVDPKTGLPLDPRSRDPSTLRKGVDPLTGQPLQPAPAGAKPDPTGAKKLSIQGQIDLAEMKEGYDPAHPFVGYEPGTKTDRQGTFQRYELKNGVMVVTKEAMAINA